MTIPDIIQVDVHGVVVGDRCRRLNPERVAALAESIMLVGQLSPILVDADLNLIAGRHRLEAVRSLGLADIEACVVPDVDADGALLREIDENLIRNDLTVLEQGEHLQKRSEVLERMGRRAQSGVNVRYADGGGETVSPPLTTADVAASVGLSGRAAQQRVQVARDITPEAKNVIRDTDIANSTRQLLELARLPAAVQEQKARALVELDAAPDGRDRVLGAVHFTSDSPEWYTPPEVIRRTVALLGAIDLDPCSNSHAPPTVPATRHYTVADDGLGHEWTGRVYMNPPYGRPIADWVAHLVGEYVAGRVTEAVALLPARTDTEWMANLREYPRCYLRGRLNFSGAENSAPFPSVVVYLGPRLDAFVGAFGDVGDVYQLVSR